MDLSNLMMLWNFLLALYIVYADVIREDGYHNYGGQFIVKHRGRMLRVLMSFRNVKPEECALHCVRHLRCRTFNYHHERRDCELTDEDFDEMDVDTINHGWHNHGTPKRVNGGWSSWRNYTECTKTCGDGTLDQYRNCDSPKPEHGGADCYGRMRRRVKCNIRGCKVDGGWSSWKNSTSCTKTCESGKLEQRRDCNSPSPEYGGADCAGDTKKTVDCNTHKCPVDGAWSEWQNSTDCTKLCGNGTLTQSRHCNSPTPQHGGADCEGQKSRVVDCNTHECKVVNIALKRTATQSSVFIGEGLNTMHYAASRAVDGYTYTYIYTLVNTKPWWEVDLNGKRKIIEINLHAAINKYANLDLHVLTSKSGNAKSWILCKDLGHLTEPVTKFSCNHQPTYAQFLKIYSKKECYLYIHEVEIYGY